MARRIPSLPMSQIIASDAPLLSPISPGGAWDQQVFYSPTSADSVFSYYGLSSSPKTSSESCSSSSSSSTDSESPVATSSMLKMRLSPDSGSESDQLCLPTHQVFDLSEAFDTPSPPSTSYLSQIKDDDDTKSSVRPSISVKTMQAVSAMKRSPSPTRAPTKKPRSSGERISTKDFIPPDVSGLSKREARLVKNRAAAFLSRQRKREEFEAMEVRVAELERENARLQALTEMGHMSSPPPGTDENLLSELEQLREQLAAAEEREQRLHAELARKTEAEKHCIKTEASEPDFSCPSAPSQRPGAGKSGASLGLMVLLYALPSLLSLPAQSSLPTGVTFPAPGVSGLPPSSSAYRNYNSLPPNDDSWSRHFMNGAKIDFDIDGQSEQSAVWALDRMDVDADAFRGMDISFDANPSEDGKIHVRISPAPSAPTSASASPNPSSSSSLAMWAGDDSAAFSGSGAANTGMVSSDAFGLSYPSSSSAPSPGTMDELGPFLGVGTRPEYGLGGHFAPESSMPTLYGMVASANFASLQSPTSVPAYTFDTAFPHQACSSSSSSSAKRRVRVALKSRSSPGAEGGEWEVEVC